MNVWYSIFICGFFSCVLAKSVSLKADKEPFTLEEAALTKFTPKEFNGVWISDSELEYRDFKTGNIKILNAKNKRSTVFLQNAVLEKYNGVSYNVSADRKYVLIKYNSKPLYRRSSLAKYVVYSIKDKAYYNVSNGTEIRVAQWGPKGNALAYVMRNNLYYLPQITPEMKAEAVTTDGIPGVIFNGATDWVYEEEVLLTSTAFYFSPNGDQLIYAKFNDTTVGELQFMTYGKPGDYTYLYPKSFKIRFPKVGTQNPVYQIWWADLKNLKNQKMLAGYSKTQPEREVYFGQVWANNSASMFVFSNRVQNESGLYVCSLPSNGIHRIAKSTNARGWANLEVPKASEKPNRFVRITAQRIGNDEYDHLTMLSETDNYVLTNGTFEVVDVLDWDRQKNVIYYRATEEGSPSSIQVYRINEAKNSKPICLTCDIKSPEGNACKHATAIFSTKFSYVVIQCNGPDPRMIYLYKNEKTLKKPVMELDNSADLRAMLTKKLMPEIMNIRVPIPGFVDAEARLYLPPNMDKSGKKKYPMLLYVYGGINTKEIYDAFKIDFEMYLTTNRSVIYAVVDARNTLNKGKKMLYAGYKRVGTIEMEDQIAVTKYLQKKYAYIDTKRTGVWGWSFGGFSTLRILQLDKEGIFKCAVAVAPAVDWVLYDTIWSERYMKSLQENKEGYTKASLFTNVEKLRGKDFYLIAGNADDNIHYQQTMLLTRALELNDIMFESLSYPDENHFLLRVRPHLYHSMDKYWRRCFNL